MWRQGDLFIEAIFSLPRTTGRLRHGVLLEGEATGHSHRIEDLDTAEVFQDRSNLYVRIVGDSARIIHQEHGAITLPRGTYRVWRQREYTPGSVSWVMD
jgi:hypothetical protein